MKFIQGKTEGLTNWNTLPHREDSFSALGIQETETVQIIIFLIRVLSFRCIQFNKPMLHLRMYFH